MRIETKGRISEFNFRKYRFDESLMNFKISSLNFEEKFPTFFGKNNLEVFALILQTELALKLLR